MCDCADCERMLQPYLDRVLTDEEMAEAEEHLDRCSYCRKRYRFEEAEGAPIRDEERVVERLSQDAIVEALSAVPHDFRDVVVLVDIGDFSYQDAAQILDIPIGTVMSRLHRGRRILKTRLAEEAVEAPDV